MEALRRNALSIWPGMIIFWIGDSAHQTTVSGHNPDDTPGVRAELADADSKPEVRALDFMVGPKFSIQDGWRLVNALINGTDTQRLFYVIYQSTIWRRATGFRPETYHGSAHSGHVHVSGHSSDDENGSNWQSVLALNEEDNVAVDPGGYNASSILRALCLGQDMAKQMNTAGQQVDPIDVNPLVDRIAARVIELLPPGGVPGLTKPDVEQVVREQLNKTRLTG